jgi:Ca2+:H+ antiporter
VAPPHSSKQAWTKQAWTRHAWTWLAPVAACAILAFAWPYAKGPLAALAIVALIGAVFASVHHAEDIAHRIGEPFGTLVLAVAVTTIEVALIVSIMLGGGDQTALARDTVFAAVMIVANGIVGLCLLLGGVRHHTQAFRAESATAALAVLAALTTLTLVLPNYTLSAPGPTFNESQLIFAGLVSLVLYGAFVFVQTIRHRDDFIHTPQNDDGEDTADTVHASAMPMVLVAALLVVSLVAVVGLAKTLTPVIEGGVAYFGAPKSFVGVVIATLVLLPESLAALKAARENRLQTSLNLALGSALASIGLTIPAVALVSILIHMPLALGLGAMQQVLLALTLIVGIMTLGLGRTTVLQGTVHLVIFATFLFLAVVP